MELRTLQQLFYDALVNPDSAKTQVLSQQIKAAKDLTPSQGLGIYRGSIMGNLSRTLRSIYPVCYQLVGEKFFEAMAVAYMRRFPSHSPDLGDYGEALPDFLSNFSPAAQLPYLADVARLEWHWHRVFHGEASKVLDYQALSLVPQERWGELIFQLPRNSILLESAYPIHRIWQVNQPDYEGEEVVSLDEGANKIFLWRQGYQMRLDLPSQAEWQLLKAFQTENPLETICEHLAAQEPSVEVASLLPLFVQRGWIVSFSIGTSNQVKKT